MHKEALSKLFSDARRVATLRSQALTPLAWLCAILCPTGTVGLILGAEELRVLFGLVLTIPSIALLGWYTYWAFKDPDRLGSEKFVIERKTLDLVEAAKDPSLVAQVVGLSDYTSDPTPPPKRLTPAEDNRSR